MNKFIIIIILLLLFSCSKKEVSPNTQDTNCPSGLQYLAINDCLNNFMFSQGSYWVYQDTLNNQTDSIYLDSIETKIEEFILKQECPILKKEKIEIYYNSTLHGNYYHIMQTEVILSSESKPRFECAYQNYTIDTMLINGVPYYDVIEVYWPSNDFSGIYYYKEGIGLVRKVEFNPPIDTITFDLVTYQVSHFPNPF